MASPRGPRPRLRTKIDRNSPLPFYVQLKSALEQHIERGGWRPGDRIPGEEELCRMFEVSRTVVRQALNEMAYAGLLARQKGRGTFVAQPKLSSRGLVQSLDGFYKDMADRGLRVVNQVLEQAMLPAEPRLARYLQLEAMAPVIKIVRLRLIEGEPIALVTAFLPYDLCRELIGADLTQQSLYAFLEETCGLTVASGQRRLEAVGANEQEARLLKVPAGSPLVLLESVSYLSDGTPLEYFKGSFRSRFEVEIVGLSGETGEAEWPA